MAHHTIVALLRLDDSRCFQIELREAIDYLLQRADIRVVPGNVIVAALDGITVGIEGIGLTGFIIRKHAEILRPIAQRRCCRNERIRSLWYGGRGKALEESSVILIVRMPPHLIDKVRDHSLCFGKMTETENGLHDRGPKYHCT